MRAIEETFWERSLSAASFKVNTPPGICLGGSAVRVLRIKPCNRFVKGKFNGGILLANLRLGAVIFLNVEENVAAGKLLSFICWYKVVGLPMIRVRTGRLIAISTLEETWLKFFEQNFTAIFIVKIVALILLFASSILSTWAHALRMKPSWLFCIASVPKPAATLVRGSLFNSCNQVFFVTSSGISF